MDKLSVLERLAEVRERAEAAHGEMIAQAERAKKARDELEELRAKQKLTLAQLAKQRFLKEMLWLAELLRHLHHNRAKHQ